MSNPVRILIADDHNEVLMAVADLVDAQDGVDIVCLTTTVEETVRSVAWHKPDLAFVDAWLRGGGAEEVARQVADLSPATCVIALASAKELATVLKLRAVGAACYDKEALSAVLPGILESVGRR